MSRDLEKSRTQQLCRRVNSRFLLQLSLTVTHHSSGKDTDKNKRVDEVRKEGDTKPVHGYKDIRGISRVQSS